MRMCSECEASDAAGVSDAFVTQEWEDKKDRHVSCRKLNVFISHQVSHFFHDLTKQLCKKVCLYFESPGFVMLILLSNCRK